MNLKSTHNLYRKLRRLHNDVEFDFFHFRLRIKKIIFHYSVEQVRNQLKNLKTKKFFFINYSNHFRRFFKHSNMNQFKFETSNLSADSSELTFSNFTFVNQSENTASQIEISHRFFELFRRFSINFQNIFQFMKQDDEYYFRVANDILRKRQQIVTTSQTQFIVSKIFEIQHASIFTFSTTSIQSSNIQRMITFTTTKKQHVSSEITMITSSTTIKSSDTQQMITQSTFTSTKNQRSSSETTIMNIRRTIKTSTLKNQKKLTSRNFS